MREVGTRIGTRDASCSERVAQGKSLGAALRFNEVYASPWKGRSAATGQACGGRVKIMRHLIGCRRC